MTEWRQFDPQYFNVGTYGFHGECCICSGKRFAGMMIKANGKTVKWLPYCHHCYERRMSKEGKQRSINDDN